MYPSGLTTFIPPTNVASRVAGQLNTQTTGFGGTAGSIEIFYEFVLRGGNNFSFVYLNSAGPAKEGIGADPGFISLANYNSPTFPQATKDLARDIGASLFSLMDTLPNPTCFSARSSASGRLPTSSATSSSSPSASSPRCTFRAISRTLRRRVRASIT